MSPDTLHSDSKTNAHSMASAPFPAGQVAPRADGHGHSTEWLVDTSQGVIRFTAHKARIGHPDTEAYVREMQDQLTRPGGEFLFGFSSRDLEARQARVTLANSRATPAMPILLGGLYIAPDAEGLPWLRGAFVCPSAQGKRLAAALGAVAIRDHLQTHGETDILASVITRKGIPNPKSVRLRKERGKLGHLLIGQPVKVAHVTAPFSGP